jgi:hypothetical protein
MPATSTTSAATTENVYDLGILRTPTKGLWRDRRVVERDWRAPVLVGREEVLAAQVRDLDGALQRDGRAVVSVVSPSGSGTSSIAECALASFSERFFGPRAPLVLRVDTSQCQTPGLLVKALFRQIDPNFQGQGASTEFLSMLLLRRLRTLGRPAVVWLDQAHSSGEFGRVVRALARPQEVLPEGAEGLPPMLLIASGERELVPEGIEAIRTMARPLQGPALIEAIRTRTALAFYLPPGPEVLRAWADLTVASGRGLSILGDLLAEAGARAEARGSLRVEFVDVAMPKHLPRHGRDAEGFTSALLEVLRSASGPLAVGDLRPRVAARCAETGLRAPTPARLWRHLVGLERKGLVRREVRLGGCGGSSTLVMLSRALPTLSAKEATA